MRENLFRGKTRDGAWRESSSVFLRDELALMLNERPIKELIKDKNGELVDVIFSFCVVEKNTVGQFTGFTDKNGKKVFEGDIVKDEYGRIMEVVFRESFAKFAFRLIKGEGWTNNFLYAEMGEWFNFTKHLPEVIGNIHDNPELLEVEA